jgi:hypothetical protein
MLFLFAGPDERAVFLVAPERYTPICAGNDVVRLKDEQRTSEGQREHGLTYVGRIWLFDSEDTLNKFWANRDRYREFAFPQTQTSAARLTPTLVRGINAP